MVNEVKFDQVDNTNNLLTSKKPQKSVQKQPLTQLQEEGVRIRLRTFQDLLVSDTSSEDNARVLEMKLRVQSNSYKVDTDELAKKLFHNIFQNNRTIG